MNLENPEVYAVKHKDIKVRMESRSGGIFTALSDNILNRNGIIYGVVLTDEFDAVHIRADKEESRNRMRGSKYIQSRLEDSYRSIKQDLVAGKLVLFSGTSCQIAGLISYLGHDYENLICVDIVCHGVPSPSVWKRYLKWQEKQNKGKCVSVDFRNKKDFGWKGHIETLSIRQTDESIKKINSQIFRTLFYSHVILRPSCFYCPYKSTVHPSDITIADYWGIDKAAPGFNDNKGVSLVLVNTDKGRSLFQSVCGTLDYQECRIEDSLQPPLQYPFEEPKGRTRFWKNWYTKSFTFISKKYGGTGILYRIKRKLLRVGKKLL